MLKLGLGALAACAGIGASFACNQSIVNSRGGADRVTLRKVVELAPDVRLFEFATANPHDIFFMPTCSALALNTGCSPIRQYTPINHNGTQGYFQLLVRLYPGGATTPAMWKLKEGDSVEVTIRAGPKWYPNFYKKACLVNAGVGLPPLLQIIRDVVSNPYDHTHLTLLNFNHNEQDICLKPELDRVAQEYPNQVKVVNVLSQPSNDWKGERGRISPHLLKKYFPKENLAANDMAFYVSGPLGFIADVGGVQGTIDINDPTDKGTRKTAHQSFLLATESNVGRESLFARAGYDSQTEVYPFA